MIAKWQERDITLHPGRVFVYNTANQNTNIVQIINRTANGGGVVYADNRETVSSGFHALRVDQAKTGNIVRPYALRTLFLTTDAASDLRITIIEIETPDLSVVFNASQVLQIQGEVQVQQPIEIANDQGNPVPVSGLVTTQEMGSNNLKVGSKTGVTTSAVVLGADSVREVIVQADPANTTNVLVGSSSAQPYVLEPGKDVTLRVLNVDKVYVKAASGTVNVNYIGRD